MSKFKLGNLESDLEIELHLISSHKCNCGFVTDSVNNTLTFAFDNYVISSMFCNSFRFREISGNGILKQEYTFNMDLKPEETLTATRILQKHMMFSQGADSTASTNVFLFEMNLNTFTIIIDLIKQIFDESNKVLNNENFIEDGI